MICLSCDPERLLWSSSAVSSSVTVRRNIAVCDVLSIGIASSRARKTSARPHNRIMRDSFRIERDTMGCTNMNANEVIGHLAGAHRNDHVNRGQSSNDVVPTAMHIVSFR